MIYAFLSISFFRLLIQFIALSSLLNIFEGILGLLKAIKKLTNKRIGNELTINASA